MAWPPTLAELRVETGLEADDDSRDAVLQPRLDAAIAFVKGRRPGINFANDPTVDLPVPDADMVLGTLMLASRWNTRRRSPDALVQMGEMGAGRVPSIDPDIERLLRIGRYAKAAFA